MTVDIRTPTEDDRDQVADVLRTSLNFPKAWRERRVAALPLRDLRCVYEGDRVIATAGAHRLHQWFGGRDPLTSGIFAVATLPEHRGTGLASAAVMRILREARDEGVPLTTLYPAVLRPYRTLGYELAGTYNEHRVALAAIPEDLGADLPRVETLDAEQDLEGLKACYRGWASRHNGAIEPTDDSWWTKRILASWGDHVFRAVVVRGDAGEIEGFAAFRYQETAGHLDVSFGVECFVFATTTGRATRSLLRYFRGFRGVGVWLQWNGPGDDPIAMLVPEQEIETPYRYRWMLRLLDVSAALEGRGYPPIDSDATIAVEDAHFPENDGPWRLEVRGGKAHVERASDATVSAIPVGALSAMYSGFLRVPDAVELGYLDADDPALPALDRLFSGPDPWCPFFF
jgi:predicted acetyltransferase